MTGQEQWVYVRKWIREGFAAHHAVPDALCIIRKKSKNGQEQANRIWCGARSLRWRGAKTISRRLSGSMAAPLDLPSLSWDAIQAQDAAMNGQTLLREEHFVQKFGQTRPCRRRWRRRALVVVDGRLAMGSSARTWCDLAMMGMGRVGGWDAQITE